MSPVSSVRPGGTVHQLNVTVADVQPPIWRRLQVPSNTSLAQLHDILQITIGWHDQHPHEFTIGEPHWDTHSSEDDDLGVDVIDEDEALLSRVAPRERCSFTYEYDFGDDWQVEIVVQKILPADPDVTYPVCLAGQRSGPPEDCGGPFGYESMLQAVADPKHEDHEEHSDWLGGEFDPEAFDIDAVNERLQTG